MKVEWNLTGSDRIAPDHVAFDPGGDRLIVTASRWTQRPTSGEVLAGAIFVVDATSGKVLHEAKTKDGFLSKPLATRTGFLTGKRSLAFYDWESCKKQKSIKGPKHTIAALTPSFDGTIFASYSRETIRPFEPIRLFDSNTLEEIGRAPARDGVTSVAWLDGDRLVLQEVDHEPRILERVDRGWVDGGAAFAGGEPHGDPLSVVVGGESHLARTRDFTAARDQRLETRVHFLRDGLPPVPRAVRATKALAFHPTDTRLLCSSVDPSGRGVVEVWNWSSGEVATLATVPSPGGFDAAWSPEGSRVAIASNEERLVRVVGLDGVDIASVRWDGEA